jgi:uncharacterized membrane protein YqiK
VEAIYQDRDQFAQLVREVASPDVGKMGIEILSFTIKDIFDNVEYLSSLGRAQTANVKRDADIGVAEANRDAGIRVSVCVCEGEGKLCVCVCVCVCVLFLFLFLLTITLHESLLSNHFSA